MVLGVGTVWTGPFIWDIVCRPVAGAGAVCTISSARSERVASSREQEADLPVHYIVSYTMQQSFSLDSGGLIKRMTYRITSQLDLPCQLPRSKRTLQLTIVPRTVFSCFLGHTASLLGLLNVLICNRIFSDLRCAEGPKRALFLLEDDILLELSLRMVFLRACLHQLCPSYRSHRHYAVTSIIKSLHTFCTIRAVCFERAAKGVGR